jgi:TIR domain
MNDFFVSYEQSDRDWAEWIAWQLENSGYTVILQAWDFRPSMNFVVEMDKATRECKRTVSVLSPSYLNSPFCSGEWTAALAADPKGEMGRLVPVLVEPCDLSGLLGQVIFIDLVAKTETEAHDELLRGLNFERARPGEQPPFPDRLCPTRFPGNSQRTAKSELRVEAPREKAHSSPNHSTRLSAWRSLMASLLFGVLVMCFFLVQFLLSAYHDLPLLHQAVRKAAGLAALDNSADSTILDLPDPEDSLHVSVCQNGGRALLLLDRTCIRFVVAN